MVLIHLTPSSPEVRRSAQRGLDQLKLQNGKKAGKRSSGSINLLNPLHQQSTANLVSSRFFCGIKPLIGFVDQRLKGGMIAKFDNAETG